MQLCFLYYIKGFPGGTSGKEPAYQCKGHKRHRFNPWARKIPWGRAWQPIAWRIPMDRGAWQATIHRLAKSWTQLKQLSTPAHILYKKLGGKHRTWTTSLYHHKISLSLILLYSPIMSYFDNKWLLQDYMSRKALNKSLKCMLITSALHFLQSQGLGTGKFRNRVLLNVCY